MRLVVEGKATKTKSYEMAIGGYKIKENEWYLDVFFSTDRFDEVSYYPSVVVPRNLMVRGLVELLTIEAPTIKGFAYSD